MNRARCAGTHHQAALLLLAGGRLQLAQALGQEEADALAQQKVGDHVHLHQAQRKAHQRVVHHVVCENVAEGNRLCGRRSSRQLQDCACSSRALIASPSRGAVAQTAGCALQLTNAPVRKISGAKMKLIARRTALFPIGELRNAGGHVARRGDAVVRQRGPGTSAAAAQAGCARLGAPSACQRAPCYARPASRRTWPDRAHATLCDALLFARPRHARRDTPLSPTTYLDGVRRVPR